MARRDCDDRNELRMVDNLSDDPEPITLYYRLPTTTERQKYHNACVKRVGNKVESNHAAARLNGGMTILTGFKKGAFERKVDGKYVAFDFVPGNPDYYDAWQDWVKQNAADLVMLLAARVYDTSASIQTEEVEEDLEGK